MKTVTAPSAMFVESLDILLDKMAAEEFDFSTVVAIGGDTQVFSYCTSHNVHYVDISITRFERSKSMSKEQQKWSEKLK